MFIPVSSLPTPQSTLLIPASTANRFPRLAQATTHPLSPSPAYTTSSPPPTRPPTPPLSPPPSLRRTIPESQRQTLLSRARYLPESDRLFLTQLLADGRTCRELAAIAQLNIPITGPASRADVTLTTRDARNTARVLQRRFQRLATRLLSPGFTYLLTHLPDMPPTRARICSLYFFQGLSIREIARSMCLHFTTVRQICDATAAKAEALASSPHPRNT